MTGTKQITEPQSPARFRKIVTGGYPKQVHQPMKTHLKITPKLVFVALGWLGLAVVSPAAQAAEAAKAAQPAAAVPQPADKPVVRWTAQDAPDFRFHFLRNVRRTQLRYATPETGTFNHHPYLAHFEGVLFASWDNHARDENKSGQHGVFRYSVDQGESWSDVMILFPPLSVYEPGSSENLENPFQTSQGFVKLDGRLYAVTCVDKALRQKVHLFNEVPRTRVGLLAREVRADATLGDIFWLSDTSPKPEPGYPAYPAGDPALVARINDYFKQPANLPQLLFKPRQWPDSDDGNRMTEPTQPWRLDNGTWVRLWRDQGSIYAKNGAEVGASRPRRHYASFSFDDGKTWTVPTRTSFPDTGARSNAGRLPDGQYYVINNPLPMDGRQGGRTMLAISLSRDGLLFDRMAVLAFPGPGQRYKGIAKAAPGPQYSHSIIVGEFLWVIYSISKEDIEVARIPLSELHGITTSTHSPIEPPRGNGVPNAAPPDARVPRPAEMPVVKWTAKDAPDFRYQFLNELRTTELLHATPETGTFNHHGFLAYHKGVLFASWDTQARDENISGQHGVFRYSSDKGATWSDAATLFPPLADNVPRSEAKQPHNRYQTSQGFVEIGRRLYAVTCVNGRRPSGGGGRIWIGWLAREVQKDGTLGQIFWLSDKAPAPEPGYPAYPAGDPELVASINSFFKKPANLPQLIFGAEARLPVSDDEHNLVEPNQPWRLADGTWVRLYRDAGSIHTKDVPETEESKSRRMYAAFSFDDGKTWTTPTRTSFPDTSARSNAGQLPDGQVYVINNPLPMSPKTGGRSLLAISLSRDGLTFDRMAVIRFVAPPLRYKGYAKTIGYQYPHSVVAGEHLWVIYSINKEDIEVARIPLAELYKLDVTSHFPVDPQRLSR